MWHGANWTFIIWGALHGCYLIVGSLTANLRERTTKLLGVSKNNPLLTSFNILITFLLVAFAWIFFRAQNINDAMYIISHLHCGINNQIKNIVLNTDLARQNILYLGQKSSIFYLAIFSIIFLETIHALQRKGSIRAFITTQPKYIRWGICIVGIISILLFGVTNNSQFIYFQF